MQYAVYVIAGRLGMGALFTVATIGKERKPVTPGAAAVVLVFDAVLVVTLVIAAGKLGAS